VGPTDNLSSPPPTSRPPTSTSRCSPLRRDAVNCSPVGLIRRPNQKLTYYLAYDSLLHAPHPIPGSDHRSDSTMIKAIFYSKFDTQEGKIILIHLQADLAQDLTSLFPFRSESRTPSPRRSDSSILDRARTAPLSDLLRCLLLRNSSSGTLWKFTAGLHKWISYPRLSDLHEIRSL